MYGYCTSDVHYMALNECCLRYRVRTRFICILRYLHELNVHELHSLILDAIRRRAGRRADDRFLITMGIGNTGAMRVEAPGLPPTMRRGRRNRGSSVRRGGWTARGAPTLLGRRRVAPATAMKKGTDDKDGGDYDATNGEVRFAELPRLREWAVQAAERRGDEDDQNLEIWNLTRACDDSEEATREYDHQEGLGPFKTWLGAIMYERGYRQMFRFLGFPGVDAEFAMALTQLELVQSRRDDGNICLLDVSCGPGMFTEKFARNSTFRTVVAVDYSRTMCEVTKTRLGQQRGVSVVQADVSDLPFEDSSFDTVHTGAGPHCWPDVALGLSEISRVMRPGGTFVATTVVLPEKAKTKMLGKGVKSDTFNDRVRRQNMPFWDVNAVIEKFAATPDFVNVRVVYESKSFLMVAADKQTSPLLLGDEPQTSASEKDDDPSGVPPILNQWWPVAFEAQLRDEDKLPVSLFGEPLVLYRSIDGALNCVQDRCLHKSCPLSLGYVQEGQLVCRYHGWRFGAEGKLDAVPCLNSCPKVSLPSYPTCVADGIVHVWPGDRERANHVRPPRNVAAEFTMRGVETLGWPMLTETREWEGVPWYSAVEITQDFTHLQFVHVDTQVGRAPLLVGGLKHFEKDLRTAGKGSFVAEYVGGSNKGGGRVTFIPPSTVINESFFTDEDQTSSNGLTAFPLCFVFRFIPVSPNRTAILVQTYQKLFPHMSDAMSKTLMNMTKVMSQDQLVLAAQRLRVAQGSPQWNLPVESDKHLLHFTRWRTHAEGEGPWFLGYDDDPPPTAELSDLSKVMKQDVFVQRPDAAQHPRPFHRPRSSVNRVGGSGGRTGAVRRGWPSGAGIDGSGVDMSEPLRALRDASAPVWRRGGIPIFVSDALNAARGNDILQRVKSGINWSKETWARPTEEESSAKTRPIRPTQRRDRFDEEAGPR